MFSSVRLVRGAGAGLLAAAMLAAAPVATADSTDVAVFTVHADGGRGVIAGRHDTNLCAAEGMTPGSHRRAVIGTQHGSSERGTLVCAPLLKVSGHTAGPWDPEAPGGPGWLSIRCPAGQHPIDGGAGFHTTPHPHMTQVHGGFGSGHDGYWHYRFHNWTAEETTIQFWGACVA